MTHDITTIKQALSGKALSVAEYLLPRGTKRNAEWVAGSVAGERGDSLSVHLSGNKAGVWADFATGQGGDLLDLWCACKRVSLPDAITEAKHWLGIKTPEAAFKPRRDYIRPKPVSNALPRGKALDYLSAVRCIPLDVIERYRVTADGDDLLFPFHLPGGELVLVKARKAEDGAKPKPTAAGCEPILFGWQGIPDNAREVVICEGEIDALSWAAYGYPALSVPFGGGGGAKQQWIESDFERLERFEQIYVALDNDQPGEEGAQEIISRLGRHRCLRVRTPLKDANECLTAGITPDVMAGCVVTAETYQPEGLRNAADYLDDVTALFWPEGGAEKGYHTPYEKLSNKLLFRPAELTLWSGATGHGKSQVLSDCMVDFIKQGSRICLASLEMKAVQSLKRLAKQAGGVDRPTKPYTKAILDYLGGGLWLYDHVGKASIKALLEVFDYARARYGCDQFVVDSLMRLGLKTDDYNGMESAVYELVNWTVQHNVHVHLVAHARKAEQGRGVPDSEDIKGPMEVGANAFNIVSIWRDKEHEDKIKAATSEAEIAQLKEKPGVILNVSKQRNGDWTGKMGLWFDIGNYRYRSATCGGERNYVQFSGKQEDA